MKARLGKSLPVTGIRFGEKFRLGHAWVSLHPAGHILGSAQVRIEVGNRVWVCSGDYKREPDPSCEPFETVECDAFITEATFGTPGYRWDKDRSVGEQIAAWWQENARAGRNSIVFGYSLGKAQRILAELHLRTDRPVLIHPAIVELAECYRAEGVPLARTRSLEEVAADEPVSGELILAPPSVIEDWGDRLGEHRTAFASGWMSKGGWGRGNYDHGFVVSDHADWDDLNRTILESRARQVYVQHRGHGALVRNLRSQGLEAHPIEAIDERQLPREQQLGLFDG
jgi:putative mRNA 3-end processing factor